ncbi:MAG: isochorismatase family protein, partial [Candidatus Dormibacteraceae bacterium]
DRGIGTRVGFGTRPALLIIDMSVGFNDPTYRVGADQTVAVTRIATLLHSARECNVPVYFFTTAYERDGRDAGMFGKKIPALLDLQAGDRAVEIDPRLAPIDGEIIITKKFSSAFFETNLLSLLVRDGIDTTILTGCSTSGCVRAAAVDGVSYGYHVIVPEECVSDRADGPHYASLFDINAKYGDVLPLAEVLEYFDTLPKDSAARMSVAH